MKKERLYELDFVRVICMLIVILYHLFIAINQWLPLNFILPITLNGHIVLGELAVPAFFILSGASLYYTYGNKKIDVKAYYLKRFKGIYPLFWITWIVMFMLNFYFVSLNVDASIPKWRLIFTVLGVDQYYSALSGLPSYALISEWFLGCIIMIYIVYPLIQYVINRYFKSTLIINLLIYFAVIIIPYNQIFSWEGFNPILRVMQFIFGIYLIKSFDHIKNDKKVLILSIICFIFAILIKDKIPVRFSTDLASISFFILLIRLWKYISFKKLEIAIAVVSKYSYAVFLNHHVIINMVILVYLKNGAPSSNGKSSISNVITISCIIICFIVIASKYLVKLEKKILKNILE